MIQFSAEQFRQRLAGLESPERRFDEDEIEDMKTVAVLMIRALRDVFGDSLDRKTVWERISGGIVVAAAKTGGSQFSIGDKFIAALLDHVKASANAVVGSDNLKAATAAVNQMSRDGQRQFIRTCVEYRMILCLEARESVLLESAGKTARIPDVNPLKTGEEEEAEGDA